jgi:hypothetical protein
MSENLQFEFHPDGDQISAFVEHALPGHEREQMLEHLAVCAECRAIVALSLPELEAPAQPQRLPRVLYSSSTSGTPQSPRIAPGNKLRSSIHPHCRLPRNDQPPLQPWQSRRDRKRRLPEATQPPRGWKHLRPSRSWMHREPANLLAGRS